MSMNEYDNGAEGAFYLPSVLSYAVGAVPVERSMVVCPPSTTTLTMGSAGRVAFQFPTSGLLDLDNGVMTMDVNVSHANTNSTETLGIFPNPMSVFSVVEQDIGGQSLVVNAIDIATQSMYLGSTDGSAIENAVAAQVYQSTLGAIEVENFVTNTAMTINAGASAVTSTAFTREIPLSLFQGVFNMNKMFPAFASPLLRLTAQVAPATNIGILTTVGGDPTGIYASDLTGGTISNFVLRVPQIQLPPALASALQQAVQSGLMARANFTRVYQKTLSTGSDSIIINQSARAGIDGVVWGKKLAEGTTSRGVFHISTSTDDRVRVRVDGRDVVSQSIAPKEQPAMLLSYLQRPITTDCGLLYNGFARYVANNAWGALGLELPLATQNLLTGYTSNNSVQLELIYETLGTGGTGYFIVDTAILYNFSAQGVSIVY